MVITTIKNNIHYNNCIIQNKLDSIYHGGMIFKKEHYMQKMFKNLFNNKNNLNTIKHFDCSNNDTKNNSVLLNKLIKYINSNYSEIGLSWINIGTTPPEFGYEIINKNLENSLSLSTHYISKNLLDLIKSELNTNISYNSYIKIGKYYYKPSHIDYLYDFILDFNTSYIKQFEYNTTKKKCKTLFNYINIYLYLILFWINKNFILPSFVQKSFNKINCIDNSNLFIFDEEKNALHVFFNLLIYKQEHLWNNKEYIQNNKLLFERFFFIINSFLKFIKKNKYINSIGNYDITYFAKCFEKDNYNTFDLLNYEGNEERKIYCIFKKNKSKLNHIISYILTIYKILQKIYLNFYVEHIKNKYTNLLVDEYIINSDINVLKYHVNKMYPNTPSFNNFSNSVTLFNYFINSNKNTKNIHDNKTINNNDSATIITLSILKYNNEIINNIIIRKFNSIFDIIDSAIIHNNIHLWDIYNNKIIASGNQVTKEIYEESVKTFFKSKDCKDD